MKYVDLAGAISITSSSRPRAFLAHARHDEVAVRLLNDFLEDLRENIREPFAAQKVLARQFKEAVDVYRDNRGAVDPAQVVRAHLIAAWDYLQSLDDAEWDALTDVANDEVAEFSRFCNSYDEVWADDDGDAPVDP